MQLLTTREAASELRVSPQTLRRFTKRGTIPHRLIGRRIRFAREDLDTYLMARAVPITNPRSPGYSPEGVDHA